MPKRLKVKVRKLPNGGTFTTSGQEARTLLLLHEKGETGIVADDFRGGPPFRLPAYTWALMHNHGLVIETQREQHKCGWHGRFVLHTPVESIAVVDPASAQISRAA